MNTFLPAKAKAWAKSFCVIPKPLAKGFGPEALGALELFETEGIEKFPIDPEVEAVPALPEAAEVGGRLLVKPVIPPIPEKHEKYASIKSE